MRWMRALELATYAPALCAQGFGFLRRLPRIGLRNDERDDRERQGDPQQPANCTSRAALAGFGCRFGSPPRHARQSYERPARPEALSNEVALVFPVSPCQVYRALSLDEANHLRNGVFRRDRDHHVHMIGHQMPSSILLSFCSASRRNTSPKNCRNCTYGALE